MQKKNHPDRNSYRRFNVIACNIYVEQFLSPIHSAGIGIRIMPISEYPDHPDPTLQIRI